MKSFLIAAAIGLCAAPVFADVNITPDMPGVTVQTENGAVEISRIDDPAHELSGEWARTSRNCPNFCVQPMVPAPGVTPIGELELLEMLQDPEAIVVDSRVTSDHETGTIPGAISIPYNEAPDRLDELGCELDFDGFVCDAAKPVALFCNGNWCGQSPTAARRMIEAGFPADKIYYYRGGMHAWRMLGLTVTGGR
ncbi:Rhodanese-related sulfurtransferase [Aliiroseovarius halocynthiae]|uniref:Rhodanese-like domain-containing protein n=1 Tax=Aliiroseovarius halocynthiae TaxID=985055 RepID=A0A545SUD0_9RHOB|nr:rhodanese-like domain-containing protein [Aliiroseovarius halocynthiae]TQV68571.1 rhodanese-like domain-containing protein [Aliiroseovarius halocynthiae]SMR70977.1 Rhodanese-related sulfurtransferase [Aliiroseovarius halocynthiae]